MNDSTAPVPDNDIDIGALASLPSSARLRQITKALGPLPAPPNDLAAYDHPISHAFGRYQQAVSKGGGWLWVIPGIAIFLMPAVLMVVGLIAGAVVLFAQLTLVQQLLLLFWVAVAVVVWRIHQRRERHRVSIPNRFSTRPDVLELAKVLPAIENADLVIRGPGFLLVHSSSRDRLQRLAAWLDTWTDDVLAPQHRAACDTVKMALKQAEDEIRAAVRSERRAVFPIEPPSLAEVDAALWNLESALQQVTPCWPEPPIRVRPMVPVPPGRRRARVSLAKPIVTLDFTHPDLLTPHGHNYRKTLRAHGIPTDIAFHQFPEALRWLIDDHKNYRPTVWTALGWAVGLTVAPWVTVLPTISWGQSQTILSLYYPAVVLFILGFFAVLAMQRLRRFLPSSPASKRQQQTVARCAHLAKMTFILNGHSHVAVADGFRRKLDETRAWAYRVERQHPSDVTVTTATMTLQAYMDDLQHAHTEQLEDAINTAPHGTVVVPTSFHAPDLPAGDLYSMLGVFQLDTCSPPTWLTETLG